MTTAQVTIQVEGLRDALRELHKLDPKLKWKAVNALKAAGRPLLAEPMQNYPTSPPLSGWSPRGRTGYNGAKARSGLQVRVGGRIPKGSRVAPAVTLVQRNAGASIYDIAGLRNGYGRRSEAGARGRAMIDKLNADHGRAQRGLWRARPEIMAAAQDVLVQAVNDVVAEANRTLADRGGD